jgi:sec-independent protein translocase protein TatA
MIPLIGGPPELIIVLLLILLLFGSRKLPKLGNALGRAPTEFRRAQSDDQDGEQ